MLNPRLNNCVDCTTVPALLSDIDCKITELAKAQYNNIIYILGINTKPDLMSDLLNYKRILQYKYCNSEWADDYTVENIASKIKLLIHK
jgi:hypothetical protein